MLERLFEVQRLDLEIDDLTRARDQIPEDLRAARTRAAELEAGLRDARQERDQIRRRTDAYELDIRDIAAKKKKAETDARESDRPKLITQYESLILSLKDRIDELENEALPLIEMLDATTKRVAEIEAGIAESKPVLGRLEEENRQRVARLAAEIVIKEGSRDAVAREVPPDLYAQYLGIRRARRGLGLVRLQGSQCGGCGVKLPTSIVQRASQPDAIVRCTSCGRLLWREPVGAA